MTFPVLERPRQRWCKNIKMVHKDECGLDLYGSGYEPVAGFCDDVIYHQTPKKRGIFGLVARK